MVIFQKGKKVTKRTRRDFFAYVRRRQRSLIIDAESNRPHTSLLYKTKRGTPNNIYCLDNLLLVEEIATRLDHSLRLRVISDMLQVLPQ
jgi:hypothetical protein